LNSGRPSSLAYVAPFAVFVAALTAIPFLHLPDRISQVLMLAVPAGVLMAFARPVPSLGEGLFGLGFNIRRWGGSVLVGVLVFGVWIGPDLLFPGYRQSWLFTNALTGVARAGLGSAARQDPWVLLLRTVRATVIVPLVEELFWRAWMMRWLIRADFWSVPLGAWAPRAFWIVALLFSSEHGSYWDVGLAAGILYNWWMVRSRSLGDLVLAHGVTNFCLSVYVVAAGRWEYWS